MSTYRSIIGLEVHVELKTKSKMFCGCSADYFGHEPNTHVCPVCLGLPGALPVPNRIAIEWCVMVGLTLNCKIPLLSKFDRKNYFYPDLPKGYQISQYDQPFCINGYIEIARHLEGAQGKRIGIRRVHMEEDTAKLVHEFPTSNEKGFTLIDFNRSGVPLVEIVTEPDFESAKEVVEYLKKLQQIVRYLGVSNSDMEKGDMRLEPNISLRRHPERSEGSLPRRQAGRDSSAPPQNNIPGYKVEVKNINSFRFVEKAINYEIRRQTEILESGKTPKQETRGWDEKKQITVSQRTKEEAHDYRYFPEPDIPPVRWTENQILKIKNQIPGLPEDRLKRFQKEYSLSTYDAEILTREKEIAEYFEEAVRVGKEHSIKPKKIANVIINKKIDIEKELPDELVQQILQASQSIQIDEKELAVIIDKVLKENHKAVVDYKKGKESAIMFLVGQVLRSMRDKIDPKIVQVLLVRKLKT